ncbi:uncharacterized protein BJ212DRAFT_1304593 [Suillus subaureus]|uniref:Uncharacterized protein n=1 Tax=Suillus subaureus TaxID=48587 RepID=A0A9P7J587_9AGAM|nr:uncharacterized protein BJ212DRAFT_1304593 [Suillus subaureus]KAG1803338.1 hypothetical protein BJ212DRAFT_1304593 [Suillus subaureus]
MPDKRSGLAMGYQDDGIQCYSTSLCQEYDRMGEVYYYPGDQLLLEYDNIHGYLSAPHENSTTTVSTFRHYWICYNSRVSRLARKNVKGQAWMESRDEIDSVSPIQHRTWGLGKTVYWVSKYTMPPLRALPFTINQTLPFDFLRRNWNDDIKAMNGESGQAVGKMIEGHSTEEGITIWTLTPKTKGDGNPPTIPVSAKFSSPGYALSVALNSDHLNLNLSTLQATVGGAVDSDGIFSDGPTTWPRTTANGKTERLLDECREVQEHERRGVKYLAWTKMAENDGGQMFKVVESNGKTEQLAIAICSWKRSCESELRFTLFAFSRHPPLRAGLFFRGHILQRLSKSNNLSYSVGLKLASFVVWTGISKHTEGKRKNHRAIDIQQNDLMIDPTRKNGE